MCLGGGLPGPDFQTSSMNLTGFGSFGTTVGSTSTGQTVGGLFNMSFDQIYGLASGGKALFDAMGAYKTADAEKKAYAYKAALSRRNAEIEELKIKDQKMLSKRERDALRRKYAQIMKRQNTEWAGKNILIGGGTPLDILTSTDIVKVADLGTLKQKEERAIFGMKVAKFNAEGDAGLFGQRAKSISPGFDFASTLLSSAARSGMSYLAWRKADSSMSRTAMLKTALGV